MQLEINVPVKVEVKDYHEFGDIQSTLNILNPTLKVKEVGCYGRYVGILYAGDLTDEANAELLKKIRAELHPQ